MPLSSGNDWTHAAHATGPQQTASFFLFLYVFMPLIFFMFIMSGLGFQIRASLHEAGSS